MQKNKTMNWVLLRASQLKACLAMTRIMVGYIMIISICFMTIALFTACSKQETVYTDEERTYLDYINKGKKIDVEILLN